MREILFRGKRKDNGEWVEGSLSTEYLKECGCVMISPTADTCFKVDPETVGQYTGLTDKNGKRIFEGDILRDDYNEENGVIEFCDGEFCVIFDNIETHGIADIVCSCYVIGNIHDNGNLLKGGAE